ncbi:unnamed protein product, partial [Urochloa humidicola]
EGRSRARSNSSRNSCKMMDFQWPMRRDHDDDDYDHPGRGRDTSAGFAFFSLEDTEPVRRERTRSPRRREGGFWRRRGWNDDHPDDAWTPRNDDDDNIPAGRLTAQGWLGNVEAFIHTQASEVSKGVSSDPNTQIPMEPAYDYISLASCFAERIGRAGNVAWSAPEAGDGVPASRVFTRLKTALLPPTMEEVELALDAIQLAAAADQGAFLPVDGEPVGAGGSEFVGSEQPAGPFFDSACSTVGGPAMAAAYNGVREAAHVVVDGPVAAAAQEGVQAVALDAVAMLDGPSAGAVLAQANGPPYVDEAQDAAPPQPRPDLEGRGDSSMNQQLGGAEGRDNDSSPDDAAPTVDDLFTMPAPPLVPHPPVQVQTPIETVLKEYIQSIKGPLPDYVIAALATLLDLDNEGHDKLTEALLQHAGDGIVGLQEEQEMLLAHDD